MPKLESGTYSFTLDGAALEALDTIRLEGGERLKELRLVASVGGNLRATATTVDGTPVPNALITISHETDISSTRQAFTDDNGKYEFANLGEIAYSANISGGLASVAISDIHVEINDTVQVQRVLMHESGMVTGTTRSLTDGTIIPDATGFVIAAG
ncbi:MAG: carboxypeptidase-like regulatory domain-containing protein [Pirellulaceae bacterium]